MEDIMEKAKKDLYFDLYVINRTINDIVRLYAIYKYDKDYIREQGFTKQDYIREINSHIIYIKKILDDIKRKL